MYLCDDLDNNGCTEWSILDCLPSETCEEGVCVQLPCMEDWVCNEWVACSDSKQVRECADWNECGTIEYMPELEKGCVSEEMIEEEVKEEQEKPPVDVPLSVNNERPEWPKIIAGFVIVIAIGIYILLGYKARVEAKVAKGIKKSARIVKKSRKKASSRKKKI